VIEAVKSLSGASGLASVNVATMPLNGAPAVGLTGWPVADSGASFTVNCVAGDVPAEFVTVKFAVPSSAMSAAGTLAWSCELLRYVVGSGAPFQLTVDVGV